MPKYEYIEDIFIQFWKRYIIRFPEMIDPESLTYENFYTYCINGKPLTEKQAKYIINILKKYQSMVCDQTFDYSAELIFPKYKHPFRSVDLSKKIYVDIDESHDLILCLKFPFSFRDVFEKEFVRETNSSLYSRWDQVRQARVLDLYSANILQIQDFVVKHQFELDQSFLHLVSEYEHAIETHENHLPKSLITDQKVELINCSDDIKEYFKNIAKGNIYNDAFYAKTMGYALSLNRSPENIIEKIVSSKETRFWLTDVKLLFELYTKLKEKVCIIVDRNGDQKQWLQMFVNESENYQIPKSKIRVCFRRNKDDKSGLNEWIKENDLGGKVEDGDILIFEHKPAKWLFKSENSVKILVTNMINPSTQSVTGDWFESHPCVIYLTDIRPTLKGNKKIVHL